MGFHKRANEAQQVRTGRDVLGQIDSLKGVINCQQKLLDRACDMIKGNESLVENFNFYFLTPLSHHFKMLHFDANPITIGYLVTEL